MNRKTNSPGLIREKASNFLDSVRTSFWLIPACWVGFAIVLAIASVELDHRYFETKDQQVFWLFGGKSSGARALLSAIAGSLITVISIAFSVTLIAIQQAATQYSPRVLTRYTKDRSNQFVLGAFMGTFVYALLVLRDVRSSGDEGDSSRFIPALSITIALLLTLISISLLVYFFHHITQLIQVSEILRGIREELDTSLTHLYPNRFARESSDDRSYADLIPKSECYLISQEIRIRTDEEGYIRNADMNQLIQLASEISCQWVWVTRAIGEYLFPGATLMRIWTTQDIDQELQEKLRRIFIVSPQRTIHQDPLYGIKQINDIALKALSPSVNDPTTAEQCLMAHMGFLATLLGRDIPAAMIHRNGTQYLVNRPGLSEYFEECLEPIRRNAGGNLAVLLFIARLLQNLGEVAPSDHRKQVILKQLRKLHDLLPESELTQSERAILERVLSAALNELKMTSSERPEEAA